MRTELIWITFASLLYGVFVVDASSRIVPRLGYGVLFKEVGTVDMSSNYWKHSFLIRSVCFNIMHLPNKYLYMSTYAYTCA